MHVQGNPIQRSPRPPFAAAVVAMFASLVGVASAVEFDEKVKAPQARTADQLRARAQAYAERDAQARVAGIDAVVRDRALARERFDVLWDLRRAIDEKRSLAELAPLGVVARDDGTYRVDLNAYPHWRDPAEQLSGTLPALNPTMMGADLSQRGLTPEALAKLLQYSSTHDVNASVRAATLPIAISFSRLVKKLDKLKRPVTDSLVMSYLYQRELAASEARRRWSESLLDAIGPSASRIVESYFGEMSSSGVWGPSDVRTGIDGQLALMRLPDFEARANAEASGVAP